MMAVARVSEFRAGQDSRNGNSVVEESVTEIPESISVVNADNNSNLQILCRYFRRRELGINF